MVAQFSALGLIRLNRSGAVWINFLSIPPYPLTQLNVKFSLVFFSDHDSVHLVFNLNHVYSHGPGVWWLNLDLFRDKDFCAVIVDVIQRHVSFKSAFPSLHDWWELLKDSIRVTAIDFGKQKSWKINSDRVRLTNSLITAKRQLIAGISNARFTIERQESQLNALNIQQQKSAQARSRAQWIEEGEKPSKYFFPT